MKKTLLVLLSAFGLNLCSSAQTTALDFTMNDCNGNMHTLYKELDSGNVVILEFFMLSCGSCVAAANEIDPMHMMLNTEHPGKVRYYTFGFSNGSSYNCANVKNWVTSNGFNTVPFDSGAAQVAYYGGMGMPTIVVVGGDQHKVLYNNIGYTAGDTADMMMAIHGFFNPTGVKNEKSNLSSIKLFPNPASDNIQLQLNLLQTADASVQILNYLGQEVKTLAIQKANAGVYNQVIDTKGLQTGVYTLKVSSGTKTYTEKFVVNK